MDWVGIIVQLIAGAVGGVGTGKAVKKVDLGNVGNIISGAIGGVGGLVGGGVLTAIVGAIKNATMKSA